MEHNHDVYSNEDTPIIKDELHIAVALSHEKEVKSLLQTDHTLIYETDFNGDQPLHIAARSGNIPIVKTLIEYDAPIGRRNYDGLTPVGVARFNGHRDVVHLIQGYYKVVEDHIGEEPEKYKYERINVDKIPSRILIRKRDKEERIHQAHLDWIDWWKRKKEHDCAISIQKLARYYLSRKLKQQRNLEHASAQFIQTKWKEYVSRKCEQAAVVLQSFMRMIMVKSYFTSFQRERLFWHRASRILAFHLQRFWRGHKGRSKARRIREIETLSNPNDALAFDEWLVHQKEAYPPCRTWNMYSEFVLSGFPMSWEERRLKRDGYFRDVKFYANNLTQQAFWTQPSKWKALDLKELETRVQVVRMGFSVDQHETASKLQSLWRARVAKRNLALLLKAHRVMNKAIEMYYKDPNNIVALCNYTLHVHVVQEDMNLAMTLYGHCLGRMNEKANDNAFILFSYAIFRARMNLKYHEYLARAKSCEIKYRKRHQTNQSMYILANEIYRLAANEKQTGNAWHNFALCRMIAFDDFFGAEKAFLRAMTLSHDSILLNNFNKLLSSCENSTNDAYDEFRKFQRR